MKSIFSYIKLIIIVIVNTFKHNLWKATFRKIFAQFKSENVSNNVLSWYKNQAIDISEYAKLNGLSLNEEIITAEIENVIRKRREEDNLSLNGKKTKRNRMGGFANIPLLYALVKDNNKNICIECGVSMGASSYAILKALSDNNKGKLISNDLPYLWIPNSIEKIGILIPEELKKRWKLFIGDDKENLPLILQDCNQIDFAHYDSNKSYDARVFFCNSIMNNLSQNATIIFDDIVDNDHFYDFTRTLEDSWKSYVLDDGNKYIGLIQRN